VFLRRQFRSYVAYNYVFQPTVSPSASPRLNTALGLMKAVLIAVVLIGVAAVGYFLLRGKTLVTDRNGGDPRVMTPSSLLVSQIPSVVDQLQRNGIDRSFAAFVFGPAEDPGNEEKIINMQYSVENGAVGFDWVLLAPGNKKDLAKVEAFIKARGHTVMTRETNGVRYLRVEGQAISELGTQIAKEMYHLKDNHQMALFTDKFEWKP